MVVASFPAAAACGRFCVAAVMIEEGVVFKWPASL